MKSNVVLQQQFNDDQIFPDSNNNNNNDNISSNSSDKEDKYKLRPRARRGESHQRSGSSPRAPPLSKYRRRTANARERTRMREINSAFEALRRCVPGGAAPGAPSTPEKLTKISTLRLATQYIAALADALATSQPHEPCEPSLHFLDLCLDDVSYDTSLSSGFSPPSLSPELAASFCSSDFVESSSSLSPSFPDESLSPFDPFLADFS